MRQHQVSLSRGTIIVATVALDRHRRRVGRYPFVTARPHATSWRGHHRQSARRHAELFGAPAVRCRRGRTALQYRSGQVPAGPRTGARRLSPGLCWHVGYCRDQPPSSRHNRRWCSVPFYGCKVGVRCGGRRRACGLPPRAPRRSRCRRKASLAAQSLSRSQLLQSGRSVTFGPRTPDMHTLTWKMHRDLRHIEWHPGYANRQVLHRSEPGVDGALLSRPQ